MTTRINEMREGFETAFVDGNLASNAEYRSSFVSNKPQYGKKVISSIEDELLRCEEFQISVAFVTMGGITPLLLALKELEKKGVPGKILTTNYLNFSEPRALEKLNELTNIELRMYDSEAADTGFHTKGYIFRKDETYRIITGSSNLTKTALTSNVEWNTRIVSTEQGEVARDILREFNELWDSEYTVEFDKFYEVYKERYNIIKRQREIASQGNVVSLQKYTLKPNSMQEQFIVNLKKMIAKGEDRVLLISSTGTGKTYASAFAMRECGFKRVLFLVHRGQLARQSRESYRMVFDDSISMGLVGAGHSEYDCDYVFATVQTLNRDKHLFKYEKDAFDCIILDEAHHSSAGTYQKVMNYFKPKLFLGMTATPDKMDDNQEGKNIYEIFNYQLALEIRLQQAMENNLLCPFHYFGITEVSSVNEKNMSVKKLSPEDFRRLTSDTRVRHIIEQAEYFGYSGDRVKGLVFCSRIDESEELSRKFNNIGYRTIALNGSASEEERINAFERLAMDESESDGDNQPLDYIFSVEILNEGVDIVEVNQVIMLRPTQSPIVFIQQLGRGLRKAKGKEYVVILDFIGNYNKNFMIPVALSGDRTYNPDNIRKYVISGNNTIPGASTIHFDQIAKDRIFNSIDNIKGIKSIIREGYTNLKNRLGRIPYLYDFYINEEIDPMLIISEYKSYYRFLKSVEPNYDYILSEQDDMTIEYLSKTVLSGVRPCELELLREMTEKSVVNPSELSDNLRKEFDFDTTTSLVTEYSEVLSGSFVSKEGELQKYADIEILRRDEKGMIRRMESFARRLENREFENLVNDIINVGLSRYNDRYRQTSSDRQFVLYEKYTRRDVSFLVNAGRDYSSTMYGMKRFDDDVFLFVTYHKVSADDEERVFVEGKPDYADEFISDVIFKWDSKIGCGPESSYMKDVNEAARKHLFVKKSDAEKNFYYMGEFDIIDQYGDVKLDNSGKKRAITKVTMKMHNTVREDILRYLQSSINVEAE
ncbi:MAG: DEAD/DEAH box helicase [Firmicutes bacterium]|nr:DEAD/DEAH box helicase [Bacillota bacterium]